MRIKPVIFAGGSGTRLWPLSRQLHPKQFIKIFDGLSLLQKTLLRNQQFGRPTIIIAEDYRFVVAEQMREINIDGDIIIEPISKNTAPCAIIAALNAQQANCDLVMLIPSDHHIPDENEYSNTIELAFKYAENFGICTIGIKPESSDTGYGYIKVNESIAENIFSVEKFIEKPDRESSLTYFVMTSLGYANYFWNSGIFIFTVDFLLNKAQEYQAVLLSQATNSFNASARDFDFIRLNHDHYNDITPISVDHAIIENIDSMIMIQAKFLWKDLGSWHPLWHSKTKDEQNNYFEGDVFTHSVKNSYISAGNKLTAVVGLDNVIVINTEDAVLIADKSKSDELKDLVAQLTALGRKEVVGYTNHLLSQHVPKPQESPHNLSERIEEFTSKSGAILD